MWWDIDAQRSACPWVFRGHADAEWELIPSAARPLKINKLKDIVSSLRKLDCSFPKQDHRRLEPNDLKKFEGEWNKGLNRRLLCEAQKLVSRRFKQLATELSLAECQANVEPSPFELGHLPHHSSEEFPYHQDDLAQHHGIPTFLLDWTYNPTIAGHFAASGGNHKSQDIAVWAMKVAPAQMLLQHAKVLGTPIPDLRMVRPAPRQNSFLAAQRGLMTSLSGAESFFDREGRYPGLDELIKPVTPQAILNAYGPERKIKGKHGYTGLTSQDARMLGKMSNQGACLLKLVLPADAVLEFRLLLQREGITKAHLMPTLDNVQETAFQIVQDESASYAQER